MRSAPTRSMALLLNPPCVRLCCRRAFAKKLNDAPLAIVDKRRNSHNVSEVMNLIGDVKGKVAVLVDDMIDTAGTITNAAKVRAATTSDLSLSSSKCTTCRCFRFSACLNGCFVVGIVWLPHYLMPCLLRPASLANFADITPTVDCWSLWSCRACTKQAVTRHLPGSALQVLRQEGAREVYACASHAVFSPPAIERLSDGVFEEVIVTNTIPIKPEDVFPELTILSVANLLGESIWRVHNATSVQALRD